MTAHLPRVPAGKCGVWSESHRIQPDSHQRDIVSRSGDGFEDSALYKAITDNKLKIQYFKYYPRLSVILRSKDDLAASVAIIISLLLVMAISMVFIYVILAPK